MLTTSLSIVSPLPVKHSLEPLQSKLIIVLDLLDLIEGVDHPLRAVFQAQLLAIGEEGGAWGSWVGRGSRIAVTETWSDQMVKKYVSSELKGGNRLLTFVIHL
jgi:hypothetical protein